MLRWLLGFLLFASEALATTPNSIITPQTISPGYQQFIGGTDAPGTPKTVFTAGSSGAKCYGGYANTNDSTAHNIFLQINHSPFTLNVAGVTIPANTVLGTPTALITTTSWPGLPVDDSGNYYVLLGANDYITAFYATSLSTSTYLELSLICVNF